MKFLKININYKDMVKDFFIKYPDISKKTYEEICDLYYGECYWPSIFLEKELEKQYNWKCNSIIFPLENNLQTSIFFQKWCESKNIKSYLNTQYDSLLFQILHYTPDIIYIHEIWHMPNYFLENLKYLIPNIKIVGWNCAPASLKQLRNQKNIDNIFTCSETIKKELINNGFVNATKINHMFSKNILDIIKRNNSKKYDITFFGELSKTWYQGRIDFLKALLKGGFNLTIFGKTDDEELEKYCKPSIYGKNIYEVIQQSKIVLNIHVDQTNIAGNIRLFEITGIGSMLLTDYKQNMNELFKEGIEAVTFKTYEEAIKLIKYYLENEEEREKIALNGQKRTLKDYTYKVLAKKIYKFSKKKVSIKERYEHLINIDKLENNKKLELRNHINFIINQTKEISKRYNKITIYGNGNISKFIKEYIPNLIAIFDKNCTNNKQDLVYPVEKINSFTFDIVIITAFGHEYEIKQELISKYKINENKIFEYKLNKI